MGEIALDIMLAVLALGSLIGFTSCERYEARKGAPEVGVVEEVTIPSGSSLFRDDDVYLQIDDKIYRYDPEGPVPSEGSIVEYRVIKDKVFDVETVDVETDESDS